MKSISKMHKVPYVYSGRLHFLNVQSDDYLLSGDDKAVSGKYLCVVFNPFLRTTADGDDQCIKPADRPGIICFLRCFSCALVSLHGIAMPCGLMFCLRFSFF